MSQQGLFSYLCCIYSSCPPPPITAGEAIEMGGIVDPERGALIYRKTTEVETVEPEEGSDFKTKKIKKVTSETSWLGQTKPSDKEALIKDTADEVEVQPWHDEEVESNPLYSSTDYDSNFQNPLYTNRQSTASGPEVGAAALAHTVGYFPAPGAMKEKSRASRARPGSSDEGGDSYMNYLSAQPGLDNADTLF